MWEPLQIRKEGLDTVHFSIKQLTVLQLVLRPEIVMLSMLFLLCAGLLLAESAGVAS